MIVNMNDCNHLILLHTLADDKMGVNCVNDIDDAVENVVDDAVGGAVGGPVDELVAYMVKCHMDVMLKEVDFSACL